MSVVDRKLIPLEDRGPLRVMFLITSMPVGGAETLLANLVRGMNTERFWPSVCCLKSRGPLGDELANDVPVFHDLSRRKYDLRMLPRLARLFRDRRVDAVVTVGNCDAMFWGRLAARRGGVPVVLSALYSTDRPDSIGRLNRAALMTRWTDGFIGMASVQQEQLVECGTFPAAKVQLIPQDWSLERMIEGYERLIATIYRKKCHAGAPAAPSGRSAAVRAGLSR
jgi:hypothetical protein